MLNKLIYDINSIEFSEDRINMIEKLPKYVLWRGKKKEKIRT